MKENTQENWLSCPKRGQWSSFRWLRLAGIGLVVLGLGGCHIVAGVAKESALSLTGRNGWDSFTLSGELPAEFGLYAKARYSPINPDNCQTASIEPGETLTRQYGKSYKTEIQNQPQSFSFKIPLSYHIGLCKMELSRVKLEINGRHGEQKWQQTYDDGNFALVDTLPAGARSFGADNTLHVTGVCTWLFQESKLYLELSKLLQCKGAGAYLQRDQLAGKTVKLAIEVNPEERPSVRNRWIKGDDGWKPCQGTDKSNRCQSPPIFKTFQMNGQTCTVYPGCTE